MLKQVDFIAACLDYRFRDHKLLDLALTHRSHRKANNERLEFLGDSILGFVAADILFKKFPQADEGDLTRLRSLLVRTETLADLARKIDLGEHIKLGVGERKSGGGHQNSILANGFESVLGAIYLDAGFAECSRVIGALYQDMLENLTLDDISKDPKTLLQEYLQARKMQLPVYKLIAESGEAHDKTFTIRCIVDDLKQSIEAAAANKRMAEQKAAALMLDLVAKPERDGRGE